MTPSLRWADDAVAPTPGPTSARPALRTQRSTSPTVSIVVPARNEARNLALVLPTLPEVHEVIVVDGHSTDDTEHVVREHPGVRFLQQTRRGKGNALGCGFEAATGDIIVMFDADGSADAEEVAAFVSTLVAGADFAKGSRVLGDGGSEDLTRLRDLGNRALTATTNVLFGTGFTDLCYGYNAFWRDILPVLAVPSSTGSEEPQWGDGFEIETMINTRVAAANLQIHEVPSVERRRIHGESNLHTFRDGFRVLRTIVSERRRRGGATVPVPAAGTLRHDDDAEALHLEAHPLPAPSAGPRVMVVGSGWRFTSGISYYTCALANAFAAAVPTDALLMRRLLPRVFYPGRARVGRRVHDVEYAAGVDVYDGVDWSWGASMRGATRFVEAHAPDVVILQWWTGAVLHSYLRLAREARRRGARVIVEWHEVQDSGEVRLPGAARYVRRAMERLLRHVDAHVVHSHYDLELLEKTYALTVRGAPVSVVPHGPYEHVRSGAADASPLRTAQPDGHAADRPFELLWFGTIRPYKGLEDLVEAFGAVPEDVGRNLRLTIVGETWEGWHAPLDAVSESPVEASITVVNRYVTDAEAREHFARADAVVLPYRRSSSSGPLQMAMSAGLPVVVTAVGGLVEAARDYEGVRFVEPGDLAGLAQALADLPAARGRRYADIRSWDDTVASYRTIFADLGIGVSPEGARNAPAAPLPTAS